MILRTAVNFLFEKLAKEFAPGLPSKERFDPITAKPGTTRLVIQRHKATTDHYDMRLQEGDMAHSWVIRSLPGEKDKMLAVQQPVHLASYLDFEGRIAKGYGAGTVKKVYDKPVEILEADNNRIKMVLPDGEYTMIRMRPDGGERKWLMIKNKQTIPDPITFKPKLKDVDKDQLHFDDPTKVWQPKVDGGHTIFRLNAYGPNRIYSYRVSEKTGLPVEHTHQVPHLRDLRVPPELHGVELRGELYAKDRFGKPLEAQEVGGILNSDIMKSREKQGEKGLLIPYIYDVVKWKGKNVSDLPYAQKYDLIKVVSQKVPELRPAEIAVTKEEKQKLFNQIQQKKHPDTVEGIVEWDLTAPGGDPKKYKIRDTHEVIIRRIFPAVTKKSAPFAGGFEYSWTPEGPVVGRVGTGFSQKMREEMLKNPEKFIGRVARIRTQQVFESGAARAPSFYQMHIEKNLEKAAADCLQNPRLSDRLRKIAGLVHELMRLPSQQNPHHIHSLIRHTIKTIGGLRRSGASQEVIEAGAMHDVGKPASAIFNPKRGFMMYPGHAEKSVLWIQQNRPSTSEYVKDLIRYHDIGAESKPNFEKIRSTLLSLKEKHGDKFIDDLFALRKADILAQGGIDEAIKLQQTEHLRSLI